MTIPTAKYENGAIFWRGSNPTFTFMRPEDAERLLAIFQEDPEPAFQTFVRDLEAALHAYANSEIEAC